MSSFYLLPIHFKTHSILIINQIKVYGSAFVKFKSSIDAENVTVAATEQPLVLKGKKLKINLAPLREGEVWPRKDHVDVERPPIC